MLALEFMCVHTGNTHSITFLGSHMTAILQSDWTAAIVVVSTNAVYASHPLCEEAGTGRLYE